MKALEQRKFDALRAVDDLLVERTAELGPLATCEGAVQVKAAIAAIDQLTNAQATANLNLNGQLTRKRAMTVALKAQHMLPITGFARAKLRGVPDIAALTRPCAILEGASLVRAARAMATAAAPHVDALVRGGFPSDVVTQLVESADALDATMRDRVNTKVARVGSTRGIKDHLASGREGVNMLHAVISRQFAGDQKFLAAWSQARRIGAKVGAVRSASSVTASESIPAAAA